jgi:DNA replication and repair protein RecF
LHAAAQDVPRTRTWQLRADGALRVAVLQRIKLRDFRCIASLEAEFHPRLTAIVGRNAQGKTSLLEAAAVLVRLQSPRAPSLARAIRAGKPGFVADGHFAGRHLQFYYGRHRKKLALDSVEQASADDYLATGRCVWFSGQDLDLVRAGGDVRRRYLDFLGAQVEPLYRQTLRSYERALRARNTLLRAPAIRWREVEAFDGPLAEHGTRLRAFRAAWVAALAPAAAAAQRAIGGEELAVTDRPGCDPDFAAALAAARGEEARLRQTVVGPHRDDLTLAVGELPASAASEGQQRTVALALRLAQAAVITERHGPPLLLIDDVFGELDRARRNALLAALPEGAQRIFTTTDLAWMEAPGDGLRITMAEGQVAGVSPLAG